MSETPTGGGPCALGGRKRLRNDDGGVTEVFSLNVYREVEEWDP